ncbi:MAG TPA: YggT family protein [Gemmatimonadaceae bacterium]
MNDSGFSMAIVIPAARGILLGVAIVAALGATLAWATRTRRLAPFSFGARFARRWIDPVLLPVERVVIRAGGTAASAPWWALVLVAVAGALILTGIQVVVGLGFELAWAVQSPARVLVLLVSWAFAILRIALIVRVVASWLPVPPYSRWIRWTYPLTEWILRPLRSVIPPLGMIDVTPVVAYFALWLVQSLLHIP